MGGSVDAAMQVTDVDLSSCPSTFGGSRYLYFDTPVTWHAAEAACVQLANGSPVGIYTHLAVMSDALEIYGLPAPIGVETWVGYTDAKLGTNPRSPSADDFAWVTKELGVAVWGPGEPDETNPAPYCAYRDESSNLLHDNDCAASIKYICECDGYPEAPFNFSP